MTDMHDEDTNPEGFARPESPLTDPDLEQRIRFAALIGKDVADRMAPRIKDLETKWDNRLATLENEQAAIRHLYATFADGFQEHTGSELVRYSRIQSHLRKLLAREVKRTALPYAALLVAVVALVVAASGRTAEAAQQCPDNAAQGGGR